ncbi:hypothetical protein [Natrarchaeobaculum aegyptiacum]|uniref:Polyprenyl synthetase n=1 Tax=Natrarchaeobaculum aegyptiacum TaxID=745377 RepID=A0A2Z2HTS6_9EURY|nr:hypothetical protein [Natrarchaeobaculum aegyptiacum]ARS90609.1 hypothetical protein B1756_13320 [Natrarchaeobaculum aegyptiacum]
MSEPTPTFDRTAADYPVASLSPAVRDIVTDALPRPDRSLAVVLCQVAREVSLDAGDCASATDTPDPEEVDSPTADPTTDLVTAVGCFEGYVEIRADLLADERYGRPTDRDAAVLASDYLHAAAYTQIGGLTDSSRRTASMYQVLTRGSTALATAFHVQSADARDDATDSRTPDAVLAGTASELGATAAGATEDAREALERYGRSLLGAIAAHPSPSDAVGDVAALVLSGRPEEAAVERDAKASSSSKPRDDTHTATVRRHVERAREAITTLERSGGRADERSKTDSRPMSRSPLSRLERATRIPFADVVDDDA